MTDKQPELFASPTPPAARVTANAVEFFVAGVPAPKGSMKGFFNRKLHRVMLTNDNPNTRAWQSAVQGAAFEAMLNGAGTPFPGAVRVRVVFFMPRPLGHRGKGKNADRLLPSAPKYHETKPDIDKLERSTLDGLTGIVYVDDSQVVEVTKAKRYADGCACGAQIRVEVML